MITHGVAFVLIHLALLQTPGSTGSINVFVTDSTGSRPISGILVSTWRVNSADRTDDMPAGPAPKRTDARGIAFYDNLPPGRYMVVAHLGKSVGISAMTAVRPDSVSTVRIPIDSHPSTFIPGENSLRKYRMPMMELDTSREERMPMYNPDMPLLRQRDSVHH